MNYDEQHNLNISKRGDRPLDFETLFELMTLAYISSKSLRFAQLMLSGMIKDGLNDTQYNPSQAVYEGDLFKPTDERFIVDYKLQEHLLDDVLKPLREGKNNDEEVINTLNYQNFHFLRTKFINEIYEILEKYLALYADKTSQVDGKSLLRKRLQMEDWYKVFYQIRHNASHSNLLHTKVEFRSFIKNETQLVWKDIIISNGMMGHDIKYNDRHLDEIYHLLKNFLYDHINLATQDTNGIRVKELLSDEIYNNMQEVLASHFVLHIGSFDSSK
jgi:hypothetical protein